ncbi:hypothetical protein [Pelagibius marinus]|uniref:hypothetical protein n=1 Tax=Pelagibius marinus TaxID=2762760 RepID=UPI001D057A0D|nr:hypothetical protein [Pelagibius marinus]
MLALVLSEVCGQPFRLASGGSQRGRDGDSAFDDGATLFEGKRYEKSVPKREIADKLMDLKVDNQGQVDLWVMGATAPVPALDAKDFRSLAENEGIGIVLLDWADATTLPPLALAVAMAGQAAKQFLHDNLASLVNESDLQAALDAIDLIAALPNFGTFAENLQAELRKPSTGLGLAKAASHDWLWSVFSNQRLARQHFGQPLAPRDPGGICDYPRGSLIKELQPAFTGSPSTSIFAVIGTEGAGKSWLVADTWLSTTPASLLVLATAGELQDPEDILEPEKFLIRKLIHQTSSIFDEASEKRWRRRFAAWCANPNPENIRITLCVDGLNQSPKFPWPRFIDAASLLLDKLGGQLVVTTRITHFPTIRRATAPAIKRVTVPEWTKAELEEILRKRGVDPDVLSEDVFSTLKNPRILGIAVKLLDAREIERMEDLSVGRLLFEHLRQSNVTGASVISPEEFAKALQEMAAELVERLKSHDKDDLRLFDARLHERLSDVASSLFFKPVGDDPDRNEIVEEGLQIALGLWLVEALEKEERNNRDPSAQLEAILEPVTPLDMTAEVVASAAEIACLRDPCPVLVAASLIGHYANMQNASEVSLASIGALVKKKPEAFIRAVKDASLAQEHVDRLEWLTSVILAARDDASVQGVLSRELAEWLSYYSLAPERMLGGVPVSGSAEQIEAERQKATKRLEKKMENLTKGERSYIEKHLIRHDDGDLDHLHRQALFLLAGMPLAPFAPSLFAWAFADALNTSLYAPNQEFGWLIQSNNLDWEATRTALLEVVETFSVSRSEVGDWAVVAILHGTGNEVDAARGHELFEHLTRDREKIGSWRLVETYCATDPCDPAAVRPENIDQTAKRFREIDVDKLCLSLGASTEDHFFQAAMPGMARFAPEVGANTIRRFAAQTLQREGLQRRQAVLSLLRHSILLDRATIDAFVLAAISFKAGASGEKNEIARDDWIVSQYSLLFALPHLSGDEQFRALADKRTGNTLLKIVASLKPADGALVESLLEQAVAEGNDEKIARILAAVEYTNCLLTQRAREIVVELLCSETGSVRAPALGIAASTEDPTLLRAVVDSGWDAGRLVPESDHFEVWYGSAALVAAVDVGLIELPDALDRMALSHYGFTAARLGVGRANLVADRIELALAKVMRLPELSDLPGMERDAPSGPTSSPPLVGVRDEAMPTDPQAVFERMAESDEQFEERQQRLRQAYSRFSKDLTNADARLVLEDLTFDGLEVVVASRPDVVERWCSWLLCADDSKKRGLCRFAVQFASAIAKDNTKEAIELFRAYAKVDPLVRHVTGLAKIPAEIEALWRHADIPEIAAECVNRLDQASTDRELALEVVAAFRAGQAAIVESHIKNLIATGRPASIARGIAVAGFCDQSEFADQILLRYRTSSGFIGAAHRAARRAYDRNVWSRHWWEKMGAATDRLDFWRYSVLLTKIVDVRFELWAGEVADDTLLSTFYVTIEDGIKKRIKRWSDKRRDQLFGRKAPPSIFVSRS